MYNDKEGYFKMLKLRGFSLDFVEIVRGYQNKDNRKRVKSRIRAEARKIDSEGWVEECVNESDSIKKQKLKVIKQRKLIFIYLCCFSRAYPIPIPIFLKKADLFFFQKNNVKFEEN